MIEDVFRAHWGRVLAALISFLGEMLLDTKEPALALREFEATIRKEPNRFRALAGAARAATAVGDRVKARKYSARLLTICARADKPGRSELIEARRAK